MRGSPCNGFGPSLQLVVWSREVIPSSHGGAQVVRQELMSGTGTGVEMGQGVGSLVEKGING